MPRKIKTNPYIKLGKLKATIAKKAHLECAEIFISPNNLKHIQGDHGTELAQLGLTALQFVQLIVDHFTEIREVKDGTYWLVVANPKIGRVAAIHLNYSLKDRFWEIKTAIPMRTAEITKKRLIWIK